MAQSGTLIRARQRALTAITPHNYNRRVIVPSRRLLAPVSTVKPQVTGLTPVGSTLTSTAGTWDNNPTGFAYQWLRAGAPIVGATASTYDTQLADSGLAVTCEVTASNAIGSSSSVSNAITVTP